MAIPHLAIRVYLLRLTCRVPPGSLERGEEGHQKRKFLYDRVNLMPRPANIGLQPTPASLSSCLASSETFFCPGAQKPPVKSPGHRPLRQGQPRCRTTHGKNLCP